MKRAFDLILSTILLLTLLPLFLVISLMIFLESGRPIFFSQRRSGQNFKPFKILKFRSMRQTGSSVQVTSSSDGRITRVGKQLRNFKLDELPQLINVFWGEMSLVGPRPEVEKFVNDFKTEHEKILRVKPGMVDWASLYLIDEEKLLVGHHDVEEAYRSKILPGKMKLQLFYSENSSFVMDLKILVWTFFCLAVPPVRLSLKAQLERRIKFSF